MKTKKTKVLLVEDDFFKKDHENLYKILLESDSPIKKELEKVFSKNYQKGVEKFLVSNKLGLQSLLNEYNKNSYIETIEGETFKDLFTINNLNYSYLLSTLSQLIFPETNFQEVIKKYNGNFSSLKKFSNLKRDCLEKMVKQTNISKEKLNESLHKTEEMYYEISATIKKYKNTIPELIKNHFTNTAKKDLEQYLPENVEIDLVSSIEESKSKLQKKNYDLIISDLGLPSKTNYDFYGTAAISLELVENYPQFWKEMDDLIPYALCPLKQELIAEQIEYEQYEQDEVFKPGIDKIRAIEDVSGILVEKLAKEYSPNTPFVYFTNRGHGENAINGMSYLGKISEDAKNSLLKFDNTKNQPFAFAEQTYTFFKGNPKNYALVIKDAIKKI